MEIKKFKSKLDLMSEDEAAEHLHISKNILRIWDLNGIGPKFFKGYLRSDVSYLRSLLESCRHENVPPATESAGSLASGSNDKV